MTKVHYVKNDYVELIEITGHSDYDDLGSDIVCASVSSMAILAINSCLTIDDKLEHEENDAKLMIKVEYYDKTIDTVLSMLIKLLKELEEEYSDNVCVCRR